MNPLKKYNFKLPFKAKMEGFRPSHAKKRKKTALKKQEIVDDAISKIFTPQNNNDKKFIRKNKMQNDIF